MWLCDVFKTDICKRKPKIVFSKPLLIELITNEKMKNITVFLSNKNRIFLFGYQVHRVIFTKYTIFVSSLVISSIKSGLENIIFGFRLQISSVLNTSHNHITVNRNYRIIQIVFFVLDPKSIECLFQNIQFSNLRWI